MENQEKAICNVRDWLRRKEERTQNNIAEYEKLKTELMLSGKVEGYLYWWVEQMKSHRIPNEIHNKFAKR